MEAESQCNDFTRSSKNSINSMPLKITVVGDGMVGKTCMLVTYMTKQFPTNYVATIFDDYSEKIIVEDQEYNICLWDTADLEDYERIRPVSYPVTDCFLLCYSVNRQSSFENIATKWYPDIQHYCPKTPVILIGTKTDLRQSQNDCITLKKGKKMMKKIEAIKYLECSALENEGLDIIIMESVRAAIANSKKHLIRLPLIAQNRFTSFLTIKAKSSRSNSTRSSKISINSMLLNITVVGDGMVGKTCMLVTYTTKQFPTNYVPTVSNSYSDNIITVDDQEYNTCLWDTTDLEDYKGIRPLTYCFTDCFLLCYSVNSLSSFKNIAKKWYPEIQHYCRKTPMILIGTKTDLRQSQNDYITLRRGKKMMKEIGAVNFLECSALDNEGLDTIFLESVRAAIAEQKKRRIGLPFVQCFK